jgi:hypothetical protein
LRRYGVSRLRRQTHANADDLFEGYALGEPVLRDLVRQCLAAPKGDTESVNQVAAEGVRGNHFKTTAEAATMHGSS